jgi:hypothetical protein
MLTLFVSSQGVDDFRVVKKLTCDGCESCDVGRAQAQTASFLVVPPLSCRHEYGIIEMIQYGTFIERIIINASFSRIAH